MLCVAADSQIAGMISRIVLGRNESQGRPNTEKRTSRELDQSAGASGPRGTTRAVTEEMARAKRAKEAKVNMARIWKGLDSRWGSDRGSKDWWGRRRVGICIYGGRHGRSDGRK